MSVMQTLSVELPIVTVRNSAEGTRFLHCSNCTKRLAEFVGGRVVIVSGDRRLTCSARENPVLCCPRCGAANAVMAA